MTISVEAIFALVFLFVILLIFLEVVHRTLAALIGAFLAAYFGIVYRVFGYEEMLTFIDFRLLIFVVGIYIIVEVMDRAGVFHFLALSILNMVGANPKRLMIIFPLITILISALLSNIAVMMIVGALTMAVAKRIKLNPLPYLISESIAANVGGLMLIISSIPTMLVGMEAGFTFLGFLLISVPTTLFLSLVTVLICLSIFRVESGEFKELHFNPWSAVKDRGVFMRSIAIFVLTLILFMFCDRLGLGMEAVAIGSAVILLVLTNVDIEDILGHLDWPTVFFFSGFFILVGGLEESGLLRLISMHILRLTGGNPALLTLTILWVGAILSGAVDNIPITLTLIPIIKGLIPQVSVNPMVIWWSLLIGVTVGGNFTPISSPPGLVTMSILDREGVSGYFYKFLKMNFIITIAQLLAATIYTYALLIVIG